MNEKTLNILTICALTAAFVAMFFFKIVWISTLLAGIALVLGITYDRRRNRLDEIKPIDWFEMYAGLKMKCEAAEAEARKLALKDRQTPRTNDELIEDLMFTSAKLSEAEDKLREYKKLAEGLAAQIDHNQCHERESDVCRQICEMEGLFYKVRQTLPMSEMFFGCSKYVPRRYGHPTPKEQIMIAEIESAIKKCRSADLRSEQNKNNPE